MVNPAAVNPEFETGVEIEFVSLEAAAMVHAIGKAGEKLAEHFPAGEKPANKLPDGVARD